MAEKLNWIWRLFSTLLGFCLFGIVGILVKFLLYPYTKDYQHNSLTTQLKARKLVGNIWLYFVRYLVCSGVLSVKYNGFERIGRKGQLVLANHPSLLDVVLIFSKESRLNCIVKKDLLNNPTMTSPIQACGFIPNTESEELLEQCNAVLQDQALLIFPEGTRTGWDNIVKLHRGAVSIGLRSAEVITPIKIRMSPLSLKKGQKWYSIPKTKMQYELTVGNDIDPQKWLAEKPLPIASRKLNEHLENFFNTP